MRSLFLGLAIVILALSLLSHASPQEALLHGRLVNPWGEGVEGEVRLLQVAGSEITDSDGTFSLPYYPGRMTLRADAPGHIAAKRTFEFYAPMDVFLEGIELTPRPPGLGFWAWQKGRYIPLTESILVPGGGEVAEIRVTGRPISLCLGVPIVWFPPGSPQGANHRPLPVPVSESGQLLPDGLGGPPGPDLERLEEDGYLITPHHPGRWVLLNQGQTAFGELRAVQIEAATCLQGGGVQ